MIQTVWKRKKPISQIVSNIFMILMKMGIPFNIVKKQFINSITKSKMWKAEIVRDICITLVIIVSVVCCTGIVINAQNIGIDCSNDIKQDSITVVQDDARR